MSGLTGLVDTLVADKLTQRPDLVRLPPSSVVPEPGPARPVTAVTNDIRLLPDPARTGQFSGSAPSAAPAAAAPAVTVQDLSSAARAIGAVLAELGAPAQPVARAAPLLALSPAEDAHGVPQALAAALTTSGLFYESHLAAFATGAMDLADLAPEPQCRLATREGAPQVRAAGSADGGESQRTPQTGAGGTAVIHPLLRAIVSQQLDVLATGTFQWRGDAWPGVPMEWTVREEREQRQADASQAPEERHWVSTMRLKLPELGVIEARVSLAGQRVRLAMRATDAAGHRLRAGADDLRGRLSPAGLELAELSVAPPESP